MGQLKFLSSVPQQSPKRWVRRGSEVGLLIEEMQTGLPVRKNDDDPIWLLKDNLGEMPLRDMRTDSPPKKGLEANWVLFWNAELQPMVFLDGTELNMKATQPLCIQLEISSSQLFILFAFHNEWHWEPQEYMDQ